MKIPYLKIDNFREAKSIDLRNLTLTTIITGPNGACKTTILDAIRVCLVGLCYDQTGKRIANEELIGPHGKAATIDMGVEVGEKSFSLFLTIKKSGTTLTAKDARAYEAFPGADGATKIRAALCDAIGTDLRKLECALNPRAYLLGPELGNMLAELCGGDIEISDVRNAADEHWEYLERLASDMKLAFDAGSLPKIGEGAFKRRTDVNKHIAVLEKNIADRDGMDQPTDTKGKPMATDQLHPLTKLLNELQAKRDALIAEKGKAELLAESMGKIDELTEQLAKARLDIAANDQLARDAQKAHEGYEPVMKTANEGLAAIEAKYADAGRKLAQAQGALALLGEPGATDGCSDGACPTCTQPIIEALREPLTNAVDTAQAEYDAIREKVTDAQGKHAEFVAEGKRLFFALDAAVTAVRTAEGEVERIGREIKSLPDPKTVRSIADLDAEIATIEGRCAAGEAKVEALGKWSELIQAREDLAEAQEELGHLEWIIMAFRDGEFIKSQLSTSKGDFEASCNAILAAYGYALSVEVDGKHVEVFLAKGEHRPAPLAQCSKAELVLAGWAVASAFAGETPICIDDMDALFGKTKNILLMSLAKRETASPVFIAGAWTAASVDLEPIRKALPNASVVWVENGEAKTQGAKVAA